MENILDGLERRPHQLKKHQIDLNCTAINLDEFFHLLLLTIIEPERLGRIELDIQPQLRQISADSRLLFRIVNTLLNNALEDSFINTAVTLKAREVPGFTRISVHQQGPGFPPEKIDTLFARNHPDRRRGDLRPWRSLPMLGKYTKAHGGHMFVCSHPGEGVSIAVYLPAQRTA